MYKNNKEIDTSNLKHFETHEEMDKYLEALHGALKQAHYTEHVVGPNGVLYKLGWTIA